MMLLAIDTSTELAGLALYNGAVVAELTWVAGRRHSTQLLPQLDRLLELVGIASEDLRAISVARGPGSFTGLRVGLAIAQGLALALRVPAFGVCSLDVLAAGQEASRLPVWPLLNAGRGRFATALYRRRDRQFERETEIVGVSLDDLLKVICEPSLLCGDLDSSARERVRTQLGDRVELASPAASLRRPGMLAQLGWQRFLGAGAPEDASLEPLYLSR